MKKYIQSMMAFAAIVSFASCSSEDNNSTIENESAAKVMTFTATQEDNEASTKATLSGTYINWESEDKISIFDGTNNNQFTLTGGAESTSGKFTGEAGQSTSYTAVYPYQENASLSGDDVTNVTLPATQTATDNSFDKNAALMMAQSNSTTLNFKNAVSLVKVTPKFACTKIELEAAEGSNDILAGKGTLKWNNGEPTINFTGDTYNKITLTGSITQGNSYYIVVPTGTLNRMWKITFTPNDGTNTVYTRYCSKLLTIERNKIINLGNFATDSPFWADEHRGNKVTYEQEVDLGIEIIDGGTTYKVIFANANLTATGLAENEYDYGDYFAWGATSVWYSAINQDTNPWSITTLNDKSDGYTVANAPFYNSSTSTYTEYTTDGKNLEASDDAARQILKGEWQLPTKDIWDKLCDDTNYKLEWTTQDGYSGYKVTSTDNSKSIFLPAAGYVDGTSFKYVGRYGQYWSGTANSSTYAYYLDFSSSSYSSYFNVQVDNRYYGYSVRPVRLVAVD